MANDVVAALINKIDRLFRAEGTFIAFQIPGLPMSPRDLDFNLTKNESGLTPQEALNAASNFASLVNGIPKFSSRWSSDGRLLWREYQTILTDAVVASNMPTTQENEELQKAKSFLYQSQEITDQLGTRTALVDSPNLAAYKQYQGAYLQAQSQYNSMKISAQYSADLTVQQKWLATEPEYDANVKAAKADWISKGYKREVEQAFATIDQITGRSPQIAWTQWKDEFEQSKLSDLQNQEFYQTFFYPAHFYKAGSENQWTKLTLDASEIEKLSSNLTGSPRELSSSFSSTTDTQQVNLSVSHLTVDLIRLPIMRPWMNPTIFKSQFWKWPDGREILSDGGVTPQGSLLGYATAIVFARNLEIKLESNSQQNAQVVNALKAGNSVSLGPLSLEQAPVASDSGLMKSDGMQIIAFICQKLPKSPNPDPTLEWSGPVLLDWLGGKFRLDRNTKISQVKVTIHTGNVSGAGTDANVDFRVNNGDWWRLDKPWYNDFERNDTDTYGPFTSDNLTVENISRAAVELKHDNSGIGPGWYVEWLRLEVYVEGQGWIAYKEWQPGWLAGDEGDRTIYRKIQ
jgi:hypothetical protein